MSTKGVVVTLPVAPLQIASSLSNNPDYLCFAAMQYQYWRGSIRFLVHFVGTAFYSCRFRFSISYHRLPPTTIEDGTSYFSKIVDAKGDAWTSFSVPYLTPRVWSRVTMDAPDTMWLTIEALTDVQGSSLPADAIYYVNIYRAAGPDFQLACLRKGDQLPPPAANKMMKSQASLVNKFQEPFDSITNGSEGMTERGLLMGDTSSTISDTLKAFYPTNATILSYPEATGSTQQWPVHRWALGFAYWRGSRRFRTVTAGTTYTAMRSREPSIPILPLASSAFVSFNEPTSVLSTTIPWFCLQSWMPTVAMGGTAQWYGLTDFPMDLGTTDTDGTTAWLAAGDDFLYLFPVPPAVTFVTVSTSNRSSAIPPITKGGDLPPTP